MKKYNVLKLLVGFFITFPFINANTPSSLILLDQIEVVIFGQEDVEIITKSDLDRPALGGGYRSQDDLIFERFVLLDAKKHKILNDEESVDAGIQMMREHKMMLILKIMNHHKILRKN